MRARSDAKRGRRHLGCSSKKPLFTAAIACKAKKRGGQDDDDDDDDDHFG